MKNGMKAIARIGAMLNDSLSGSFFPPEALEYIAQVIPCRSLRLFRMQYDDTGTLTSATCLSSCPHRGPVEMSVQEISRLLEQMDCFTGGIEEKVRIVREDGQETLYFPVDLNGHLSCVLTVSLPPDTRTADTVDFLLSCLSLIQIWNSASNIKKSIDDVCDFTREPLYIMNMNGEVVLWNKAMASLSGWDCSQIIGKGDRMNAVPFYGERRLTVPHLILNPDPDFENRHYMKFKREGDVVHALTFLPNVPEDGVYVSCKTQRLYDINGVLHSAIHALRDLTQLRQMEMDLHKLRFIGRLVNDLSDTAIIVLTREGVSYYNDKAISLLGLSRAKRPSVEHILAVSDNVAEDERAQLLFFFKQMLSFEEPSLPYIEFSLSRDEGVHNVRCNAHLESGDEPSVLLTFTDITRERALIAQAKDNEMRIMRADRLSALGVLAAGVAHEIAQPLSIIKVLADTYLYGRDAGWENEDDEDVSEHFAVISRQVNRMSKVIDGIRVFSRDDKGDAEETAASDMNQALTNILSILEQQFANYGIMIKVVYHETPLMVRCCLSRLEQVVINLLVNSRQALEGCEHSLKEIVLNCSRENGHALLQVSDNATGIPQDDIRKIFDPFFTTKEIGQGTGLGLTICKSIINNAGGDMEVWNNAAGGCTFQIILPVVEDGNENTPHRR